MQEASKYGVQILEGRWTCKACGSRSANMTPKAAPNLKIILCNGEVSREVVVERDREKDRISCGIFGASWYVFSNVANHLMKNPCTFMLYYN